MGPAARRDVAGAVEHVTRRRRPRPRGRRPLSRTPSLTRERPSVRPCDHGGPMSPRREQHRTADGKAGVARRRWCCSGGALSFAALARLGVVPGELLSLAAAGVAPSEALLPMLLPARRRSPRRRRRCCSSETLSLATSVVLLPGGPVSFAAVVCRTRAAHEHRGCCSGEALSPAALVRPRSRGGWCCSAVLLSARCGRSWPPMLLWRRSP